jgi:thiol:disulfide interchange protein DsbD
MLGITTTIFIIYLIPGLWGAPLKLISGFPPPMSYSESPFGVGSSKGSVVSHNSNGHDSNTHIGPQGLPVFHDLDKGLAYAKKVNKPAFLDFTGHACVNCRKMEENVWGEPGVIEILTNDVVVISLYVDDKRDLPSNEQIEVEIYKGKIKKLKTIGNKWSYYQAKRYKTNTQPYYRILGPNGEDLTNGSADYEHHGNAENFSAWLSAGLKLYNETK